MPLDVEGIKKVLFLALGGVWTVRSSRVADCASCGLRVQIFQRGQPCLCGTPTEEPYEVWSITGLIAKER